MTHPAQQEFIEAIRQRFVDRIERAPRILEIGARDINGSLRPGFPANAEYLAVDLAAAPGVDLALPGELLQLPDGWADIAISTECFEHARAWKQIFTNMIRCTKPGGLVVVTCAGVGRPAHGTVDSSPVHSPLTLDHYRNLGPDDLREAVDLAACFTRHAFEVDAVHHDTYFWGLRAAAGHQLEYMPSEEALARARGQVGRLAETIARQRREIEALQDAYARQLVVRLGRGIKRGLHRVLGALERLFAWH